MIYILFCNIFLADSNDLLPKKSTQRCNTIINILSNAELLFGSNSMLVRCLAERSALYIQNRSATSHF